MCNLDKNTQSARKPSQSQPLVLDVAGGKGELAARLCLCHNLRVVMVDPRPANVTHAYKTVVVPRLPKKWQQRLQQQRDPNFVQEVLNERFQQIVDYFSLEAATTAASENNQELGQEHEKDDESVSLARRTLSLQEAVQQATLLVGMHADGATEAIVDVALHYKKPFVVVPCCVFPNLFPNRQVRQAVPKPQACGGLPPEITFYQVRTHEQFCQYLLDKDERFQKSILPFEGRNVAIWWDGK